MDPPSPCGCGPDSAPASEAVTIPSADWRRTASEEVRAANQFAAEELVLPASVGRAKLVTSQDQEDAPQKSAARVDASAGSPGVAVEGKAPGLQPGCSRSEAGTVQETQSDPKMSSSAGSGGWGPPLAREVVEAAALGSCGPWVVPSRAQPQDHGHASVHTVAETQGGSSLAKGIVAEPGDEAIEDVCEDVAGLPDVIATQLQDAGDMSSFPETQLEPVLPSWHTCATTQMTEQQGCAGEDGALTPSHSTDTQPADAPLSDTCDIASIDTSLVEDAEAAGSPCIQEQAASVDPLQEGLKLPCSAEFQPGAAPRMRPERQLSALAGGSPPLPFDESGNVQYLSATLLAAEDQPTPDRSPVLADASLPREPGAAAPAVVGAMGALQDNGGVVVPSDPSGHASSVAGITDKPGSIEKVPEQPEVDTAVPPNDQQGCNVSGIVVPEQAVKGERRRPSAATGPTQATVCDSSDGEHEGAAVADTRHPKQPLVAAGKLRMCQSASCGTVPETHTGDGHARVLPSQQVLLLCTPIYTHMIRCQAVPCACRPKYS